MKGRLPSKQVKDFIGKHEKAGWTPRRCNNNHIQLFSPDGKHIVTISSTPGDVKGLKNAEADIRRYLKSNTMEDGR